MVPAHRKCRAQTLLVSGLANALTIVDEPDDMQGPTSL
jgi:hypothetical protein